MTDHLPRENGLGREKLTQARRIELLERDRAQQSRMIHRTRREMGKGFTPEQLGQIRAALWEEIADAGLRLDDADHQDEAREDFRFLRRFRLMWDGGARKIGKGFLVALISIGLAIIGAGSWAWINSGGKLPT